MLYLYLHVTLPEVRVFQRFLWRVDDAPLEAKVLRSSKDFVSIVLGRQGFYRAHDLVHLLDGGGVALG